LRLFISEPCRRECAPLIFTRSKNPVPKTFTHSRLFSFSSGTLLSPSLNNLSGFGFEGCTTFYRGLDFRSSPPHLPPLGPPHPAPRPLDSEGRMLWKAFPPPLPRYSPTRIDVEGGEPVVMLTSLFLCPRFRVLIAPLSNFLGQWLPVWWTYSGLLRMCSLPLPAPNVLHMIALVVLMR